MILNAVVGAALLFSIGFLIAWLARPDLRAAIERPKHRFQASVDRYDETQNRK